MNSIRTLRSVLFSALALVAGPGFAQSSWTPARLLNDAAHTGDIKEPRLAGAGGGGFHAMYRHFGSGNVQVQYRRFQNGALLPAVEVHRLGFLAGGEICEAGDGSIHLVWENWADNNEQIWWAKSSDGGATFPAKQSVTSFGTNPNGQAKNPMVVPFGVGSSSQVLALSWGAPPVDALYYNRYNGTSWQGHTAVGQATANSYAAWGSARDPRDGSVFRCYGVQVSGVWQVAYRRFNGTAWDPQVIVSQHTNDFASRPAMAINASGQVLVVWDKDEAVWARLRDPISGWGPQTRVDDGYTPAVTAVPGTDEFYLVHPYPKGAWSYIVGRKWANGTWGPRTRIMSGIADDYSPNCDVTADESGNLYCTWEYWGSGQPRAWFSVLSNQPPAALVSPTNLQGFLAPGAIRLEAVTTDAAATLTRVEFLQGTNSVGVRTAAPFSITLVNVAAGNHSFSVVGSNSLGAFGTSAPVNVVVVAGTNTTLVSAGAVWKYFTNATDLGTAWRASNYNDSAWPAGPAQLGFGDGDEATPLSGYRQRITTYFRHSFHVPFARAVKALHVRLLRDDGAAVYLNGAELLRNNLPDGATYQTSAIAPIGGTDETTWLDYVVTPAVLVPGMNVIAVEMHQSGTNSSDLSFDLELTGLRANPSPPRVAFASPAPHQAFLAPASFTLVAMPDDDDGDVQRVEFWADGEWLASDVSAPYTLAQTSLPAGEYTFIARAIDSTSLTSADASISIPVVAGAPSTLVATGAIWKYRDNGIDPGASWTTAAYNDAGWNSGAAQLGYGDGDEATTISYGADLNNKHITTWFRHALTVADARDVRGLTLRVLRDDGAIAYLNGVEVFRSNLPPGPVNASTPALLAVAGADENTFHVATVDPALLTTGTNVLAVEVHQSSGNSSDLSFDAELTAVVSAPPTLRTTWNGNRLQLQWSASVPGYSLVAASNLNPPVVWQPVTNAPQMRAGQNTASVSNEAGSARFFRLQR